MNIVYQKKSLRKNDLLPKLSRLDLSHCNLSSNLPYLLQRRLCLLESLILSNCNLQQVDFQCLAEASVYGKLKKLRHLDVSYSHASFLAHLFSQEYKWQNITNMNVEFIQDQNGESFSYLKKKVQAGCLKSLQELTFSFRHTLEFTRSDDTPWRQLHTMGISAELPHRRSDILSSIAEGIGLWSL